MPLRLPDWTPSASLDPVHLDWLDRASVSLALLRLERIDPLVSGNKWFKLAPHLARAAALGAEGVISLGGAHSNHLHALAAAGCRFGFPCVGLLRGEPVETPTVSDLRELGMALHWLGYGGYRARHLPGFWEPWAARYPGFLQVPEGGGGLVGAQGCAPLVAMIQEQLPRLGWDDYDALWLAAGTGTTLAGLVLGEGGRHPVFGALAVSPDHGVAQQVSAVLAEAGAEDAGYRLLDASRGGFARVDAALAQELFDFEARTGIELDPLYTAKALIALRQHVEAGYLAAGSRVIMLHTGGLQGRRAMLPRLQRLAGYTATSAEASR
ncbi:MULTISPECIES: 1-aminocyclopropane-1-carboxylate deaminase/D-cysteine desulfhydrase [unclassified Pseudomonas]|uniref:1-aminocyclopropane-1-carboxylate deaminase/D-cysteine desulfhydrase n=1 Tax=unclassified Pseudomonas TaxID=196821 RepID=UPI000DA779C2|nr:MULTISPECIES: pyridoxal-phosphate dependent enzyme [unclassified Pseudomonas]MDW3713580.1 pyridoxal-phosphate dependent enzyme [Pseudomonas sp. 2023EL-01195]PZE15148.1 1-aminocyclopropane-1-carboxylate deaminase [Pseudomonas sp. 57B-090624]